MVTPPEKDNLEPTREVEFDELAPAERFVGSSTGERLAWISEENLPDGEFVTGQETVGTNYVSTRGPAGWVTEKVVPSQSREDGVLCPWYAAIAAYSPDLSKAVLADGWAQNYREGLKGASGENCGRDEPLLAPGEPEGFQNLFMRDNVVSPPSPPSYQLIDVTPSDVAPQDAQFDAGSADLSHIVFDENAPLTENAPNGDNTYEWSNGHVRLVTVLPDGKEVKGTLPWATEWENLHTAEINVLAIHGSASNFTHTVSTSGSRVFFEAEGNLYMREDGVRTAQLDLPGGGGKFMVASTDGSRVFFLDEASKGLTGDTVEGSGENLYEYDSETGGLIDLTAGADARVLGVTGASEDGSYVYFAAEGALAQGATTGKANLYVSHGGLLAFVAALDGTVHIPTAQESAEGAPFELGDYCDWSPSCLTARVSPNGAFLAFTSIEPLTRYGNQPTAPGDCSAIARYPEEACRETFLYDANTGQLSCASCDPTGAAPVGIAAVRMPSKLDHFEYLMSTVLSRNVTDSGQVFFDSPDALLPQASNGKRNVYEYHEGHLFLLSSGTGDADSYFVDASTNGNDVFILTADQAARRDRDSNYDVYDARVEGGYPEPASPPECADEGCRGLASPSPALQLPDSISLVSSGNLAAPRGKSHKAHRKARHKKSRRGGHRRTRRHHKRRSSARHHGRGGVK